MFNRIPTAEWRLGPGHQVVDARTLHMVSHVTAIVATIHALSSLKMGIVAALVTCETATIRVQDGVCVEVDGSFVVTCTLPIVT